MRFGSVCSGIEAASVAWHPLGWRAAFYSEIDAFPSAVLTHHYPDTPNFGDMTKFKEWPDAVIDILVGGTPCQSFSVAGLRKGLDDPRGNLMLVYLAIARRYRPRWLVWENVPGVLSSNKGRDFGTFLGGLGELGYGFAYRVFDAQYAGLAQRRKRVFVVGCLGDWRRAAAVLFERASLRGDPAPRRETRERLAPSLAARTRGGGGLGTDAELDGALIPEVANPLTARMVKGVNTTCDEGQTMIAHAPRADGTPLVPVEPYTLAIRGRGDSHDLECRQDGVANAILTPNGGRAGIGVGAVAFDTTQITHPENRSRCEPGAPSPTLAKDGHPPAIAYGLRSDASRAGEAKTPSADAEGRVRLRDPGFNVYEEHAPTLDAGAPHAVAFADLADPIAANQARTYTREGTNNFRLSNVATSGMRVRRLTPRECERLQGFPDDYTLIPYRNKPAADGPRYKALGNSMAVPCMRWIGERIAMVDAIKADEAAA